MEVALEKQVSWENLTTLEHFKIPSEGRNEPLRVQGRWNKPWQENHLGLPVAPGTDHPTRRQCLVYLKSCKELCGV